MNYIRTVTGQKFFFENPGDYRYSIEEIARGLSRVARYNGHTDEINTYTVAQHSVMVSYLVPEAYALQALLHDASEFVTGDITKPLKNFIDQESRGAFSCMEDDIQREIHRQLRIKRSKLADRWIKIADKFALRFEQWSLQLQNPETYYPAEHIQDTSILDSIPGVYYTAGYGQRTFSHDAQTAERMFLKRWNQLQEQACQKALSSNASAELCTLLGVKPSKSLKKPSQVETLSSSQQAV